jgi:hypothetical protein
MILSENSSQEIPEDIKSIYEAPPTQRQELSFWRKQRNYFIHGFLWWLFNIVGLFVFPFLTLFLIAIGSIIGLIIGFVIMFLAMGYVNTVLAGALWFEMPNQSLMNLLGHGILLGISILIVGGLTVMLPIYLSRYNIYVTAVSFIWGCYIDGYLGRLIAKNWSE